MTQKGTSDMWRESRRDTLASPFASQTQTQLKDAQFMYNKMKINEGNSSDPVIKSQFASKSDYYSKLITDLQREADKKAAPPYTQETARLMGEQTMNNILVLWRQTAKANPGLSNEFMYVDGKKRTIKEVKEDAERQVAVAKQKVSQGKGGEADLLYWTGYRDTLTDALNKWDRDDRNPTATQSWAAVQKREYEEEKTRKSYSDEFDSTYLLLGGAALLVVGLAVFL